MGSATPVDDAASKGAGEVPPLDFVDSRWWYWIVAYPITVLLFVPVLVVAAVLFFAPAVAVRPELGAGRVVDLLAALLVLGMFVLAFAVVVLVVSLTVILPVALYMDARAVNRADLEWDPDPLLYGLLGLLQIVTTPLVGIAVSGYYLYRRHEHAGVP